MFDLCFFSRLFFALQELFRYDFGQNKDKSKTAKRKPKIKIMKNTSKKYDAVLICCYICFEYSKSTCARLCSFWPIIIAPRLNYHLIWNRDEMADWNSKKLVTFLLRLTGRDWNFALRLTFTCQYCTVFALKLHSIMKNTNCSIVVYLFWCPWAICESIQWNSTFRYVYWCDHTNTSSISICARELCYVYKFEEEKKQR